MTLSTLLKSSEFGASEIQSNLLSGLARGFYWDLNHRQFG